MAQTVRLLPSQPISLSNRTADTARLPSKFASARVSTEARRCKHWVLVTDPIEYSVWRKYRRIGTRRLERTCPGPRMSNHSPAIGTPVRLIHIQTRIHFAQHCSASLPPRWPSRIRRKRVPVLAQFEFESLRPHRRVPPMRYPPHDRRRRRGLDDARHRDRRAALRRRLSDHLAWHVHRTHQTRERAST